MSDAIRRRLLQVADARRRPSAAPVPNALTLEAMKELDEGKGARFGSVKELFLDLDESRPGSGTETIRPQPGPDGGR